MAQAVTTAAPGARRTFNSEVELETSANCLVNGFVPKPGMLYLGERGLEFRGESTFAQRVSWDDVELVSCDIFRGHVRTMDVHTSLGDVLTLTVDDDIEALRTMAAHVGRDKVENVNEVAPVEQPAGGLLSRLRGLFG